MKNLRNYLTGVGLGLASLVSSGCGFLEGVAIVEAAQIQARAMRDAAGVRNNENVNANALTQSEQPKNYPYFLWVPRFFGGPKDQFFTYNHFRGDLNRDGHAEAEEYMGFNKKEFYNDENFSVRAEIFNRNGALLRIKFLDPDKNICGDDVIRIDSSIIGTTTNINRLDKCGRYTVNWEIGDEIIGTLDFYIKGKTISKAN